MTGFSKEMQDALRADAEKLSAMTGAEHTVEFFYAPHDLERQMTRGFEALVDDLMRRRLPHSKEDEHFRVDPLCSDAADAIIRLSERLRQADAAAANIGEALRLYRLAAEASGGCGDGNCVVLKPIGMHTNGGCRCYGDRMKAQRMMRAGQRLYEAIAPSPTASQIPR